MTKKNLGTALITGGAKRLGKQIALMLANLGYDLAIHYNNSQKEAQDLQQQIQKLDVNCTLIKANLLDEKEVGYLIKEIKKLKNWNLLINNASIFKESKFTESDVGFLEENFKIHLKIPYILSQELARNCAKNNLQGNIINMIDKNISRYETKYFDYLLSKKSLAEFTKIAALQLAPNIRVNAIAPGFILNNIHNQNPNWRQVEKMINKIPLQKKGDESDITKAIDYLINNDFITGHILFIDGGAALNYAG